MAKKIYKIKFYEKIENKIKNAFEENNIDNQYHLKEIRTKKRWVREEKLKIENAIKLHNKYKIELDKKLDSIKLKLIKQKKLLHDKIIDSKTEINTNLPEYQNYIELLNNVDKIQNLLIIIKNNKKTLISLLIKEFPREKFKYTNKKQ
jgi:hypothetical protein